MTGTPKISTITQDLPENEKRLHKRLRRGKYGEIVTDFDLDGLSGEQKNLLKKIGRSLKKINITSFFNVISNVSDFKNIDSKTFFEEYIADSEKRVGGRGSNDSELKKREKQSVEDMLEMYKVYEKNGDGINPYLSFLLELNEYTVVDDIDAMQYQIVYEIYISEHINSPIRTMLADLSLNGTLDDPGLITESALDHLLGDVVIILDATSENPSGEELLEQKLLSIIGYQPEDREMGLDEIIRTHPYVLQRIHQFIKTTPSSDLFGVLVEAPMQVTTPIANKLLIETIEETFDGQLKVIRQQIDALPDAYEGAATDMLANLIDMTEEEKRRRFASILGIISQEGVEGGAAIVSVTNPFEITPEQTESIKKILKNISFTLVPVIQRVGDSTIPTVILGTSRGDTNKISDRITYFHSYGVGTGMTLISGRFFGDVSLATTQGINVEVNPGAMDGYGNDSLFTIIPGISGGYSITGGTLHGAVGLGFSRDKLGGHERELLAKQEPLEMLIDDILVDTKGRYTIKQGVELLQQAMDNRKKALRMQGKIEDLVQYVIYVVQQFKTTGLLQDVAYFKDALIGTLLHSFDEAGLMNLKHGRKSLYVSRFGVLWDIDFKNFLSTLGNIASAPWKVFSISVTGHSKIGYTLPTPEEARQSINEGLQSDRGMTPIDKTSNHSKKVIDTMNTLLGYGDGGGRKELSLGEEDDQSTHLGIPLGYNVPGHTLSLYHTHHDVDFSKYLMTHEEGGITYVVFPEKMPLAVRTFQLPDNTIAHTVVVGDRVVAKDDKGTQEVIDMSQKSLPGIATQPDQSLHAYDNDIFETLQENERREAISSSITTLLTQEIPNPFLENEVIIDMEKELITLELDSDETIIEIEGEDQDRVDVSYTTITVPYGTLISGWNSNENNAWKLKIETGKTDAPLSLAKAEVDAFTNELEVSTPIGLANLPPEYKEQRTSDDFRDFMMTLRYEGKYPDLQPSSDTRYTQYLTAIGTGNITEGERLLRQHEDQFNTVFGAGNFEERMSDENLKKAVLKQIEGDLSLTYITEFKHLKKAEAKKKALELIAGSTALLDEDQKRTLTQIITAIYDSDTPVDAFYVNQARLEDIFGETLSSGFDYDSAPKVKYGYLTGDTKPLAQLMMMIMPSSLIMRCRTEMYKNAIKNTPGYAPIIKTEEAIWEEVMDAADTQQSLASTSNGTGTVEQGVVGLVATYGSQGEPIKRKQTPNPRMEPGTFVEVNETNAKGELDVLQRQYLNDLFADEGLAERYRVRINNIITDASNNNYYKENVTIDNTQELIDFLLDPNNGTFTLLYGMYGPCKNRLKTHRFSLKGTETAVIELDAPTPTDAEITFTEAPGSVVYSHAVGNNDPYITPTTVTAAGVVTRGGGPVDASSETEPEVTLSPDSEELMGIIEEGSIQIGVEGTYTIGGRTFEGTFIRDPLTGNISFVGQVNLSSGALDLTTGPSPKIVYSDADLLRLLLGGR